ncbi:MAG: AI-2E family transporter [Lachnospiraceae bacterium]|nr:AI-2E family transporter [Lachnospiraceae bacterium]
MKEVRQNAKKWIGIVGVLFILYLMIRYWEKVESFVKLGISASMPLFIGCVIAYVVNILMSCYEKWYVKIIPNPSGQKMKRPVCLIVAFLSLCGIVFLIVNLILPELLNCIASFIRLIPGAVEMVVKFIGEEQVLEYLPFLTGGQTELDITSISKQIEQVLETVVSGVGGAVDSLVSVVSGIFSVLMNVVIGLIFSIYVLADKEKLGQQSKTLIRTYFPNVAERFLYVISVLNESFHKFIVGQCIEAVVLGSLCILGMSLLKFPYAVMIGVFIGFTALIPIAGAYIGAGVGVVMIMMTSPMKAIPFLVFILVLQQLEGNLIYPRVVGQSIGLPGIWVLTAITVGGGILGVGGMLVAVPLFAAGYRLLKEDVEKRNIGVNQVLVTSSLEKPKDVSAIDQKTENSDKK